MPWWRPSLSESALHTALAPPYPAGVQPCRTQPSGRAPGLAPGPASGPAWPSARCARWSSASPPRAAVTTRAARTARPRRSPWPRSTSSATRVSSRSGTPPTTTSSSSRSRSAPGTTPRPTSTPSSPPAPASPTSRRSRVTRSPRCSRRATRSPTSPTPPLEGRWLDFVVERGTNSDGQLIGYGTDVGPEGICYRADLFEKAGLPTDREEVAALMGTWDDYFAARRGVRGRGARHRVVRLLRRPRPGDAQPGREPLRDRRRRRSRPTTPSSRPCGTP